MRRPAALSLVAASLAACGGGGEAADVVGQTADNLEQIESGNIFLRLVVAPKSEESARGGFELRGPFSLRGPGDLPVARVTYTQIGGSERTALTLISTGEKAYVELDGQTYELPPEQATRLRAARAELVQGDGLGELGLEDWIEDPELTDGGSVGGAETDRIDGRLDVAATARHLIEVGRSLAPAALGQLPEATEQTIERASRSATIRLFTGEEDQLLRRLDIDVDLGFDVPSGLRGALGRLSGARIEVELRIDNPNELVRVADPRDALPHSELPS